MTPAGHRAAAILLCAALLPGAFFVFADDKPLKKDYALIFGTVYAPDDRPARGVRVKISRAGDKKAKWELVSDRHGEFAQRVPQGKAEYLVTAEVTGNKGLHAEARVQVEHDERVDLSLHLTE